MKKRMLFGICLLAFSCSALAQETVFEEIGLAEIENTFNQNDETARVKANDVPKFHPHKTKSVHFKTAQAKKRLQHMKKEAPALSWAQEYANAKENFSNATGISYSLDASVLGQRGAPNGKITPWQTVYYGSLNWNLFQSERFGSGSLQMAYTLARYWKKNGSLLGNNILVATPLNDYTEKANYFDQLSYTQNFAGFLKNFSLTLGQFPLYNFDGTAYNSNQQINFVNEALSQNLTGVYATAGVGGYLSFSPNSLFSFSAGFQDATNISGNRITVKNFGDKKFTSFLSGTYTPKNSLGELQLSLLFYYQPSVADQEGNATGWSFNAQQDIGKKLSLFARINGVSKALTGFNQSYVIGGVYNNPLNRNSLDQIGLAYALNKIDKEVMNAPRNWENVLEAYWSWGINSFMIITPDVQFYINPALNNKSKTATVASLRATLMF